MAQATEFIDLSDHDAFVEAVPHEAFAALREHDPVHWNPEPDGPGFWAVTRYEDIHEVNRCPEIFSNNPVGIPPNLGQVPRRQRSLRWPSIPASTVVFSSKAPTAPPPAP